MREHAEEFFGGVDAIRDRLARAITEGRIAEGLQPHELGELAGLDNPEIVAEIEAKDVLLREPTAVALMLPLGIAVDRVLRMPELTEDERRYWRDRMRESHTGRMAGTGGPPSIERDIALGLFLRFLALQSLND